MTYSIYITGYCILFMAIIANIIATYFHILTWYELIQYIQIKGITQTISSMKILDFVWLFFIYPILLSTGYKMGIAIYKLYL